MPIAATSTTLQTRGLALAAGGLRAAGQARVRGSSARVVSQADVLRLFVPSLAYASAQRSVSSVALTRRPYPARVVGGRRYESTETQTHRSGNAPPPPPPSSQSQSSPRSQRVAVAEKPAPAPAASSAAPAAPAGEKGPSPATPVSSNTSAELGSPANQTSASQAQLSEAHAVEVEKVNEPKPPLLTRAWGRIKEEAQHYWHGTKLLAKEVRISGRLLRRLMLGYNLTRREHRQLKRTTADLLRLIPFIPFVIIPLGELLLPVAIKVFPNMLPSTFESKFAAEEKRRGLLKVRLEMAKFLQETIREGGLKASDKVKTSDEFKEFFRKVRSTGESPTPEDIIKVAKLFEDDLTLDNLSRPQLVSMGRYMQINAFGTDNYLRYQIRHKLSRIRQDDIVISAEGVDTLSIPELQSACQNRGIQTMNLSPARLREELTQWIDLHLHQRISGTLLILSKAFNYVSAGDEAGQSSHLKSLEATLSSLPDNLLNEAELNVSRDMATNKQRLEVLEQQEDLIEDEAEQEQEEEAARKAEKQKKSAEKARQAREEEQARALLPKQEMSPEAEDARMTNEQLTELGEALSILSAKSSVLKEREELAHLMKETQGTLPEGDSEGAEPAAADATSASSRSLAKRVRAMLTKIDEQLEEYDRDVGTRMHMIEASPTGKISVDDLEQALRLIKHRPDDEVIEKLVDKLDVDHDGLVPLDDVLELARAESGLGILRDEQLRDIKAQGQQLKREEKPRKSDIVE